jgi:hypothetical protein
MTFDLFAETAKKVQEERIARGGTPISEQIRTLNLSAEKNVPFRGWFITDFYSALPLLLHDFLDGKPCSDICNCMYSDLDPTGKRVLNEETGQMEVRKIQRSCQHCGKKNTVKVKGEFKVIETKSKLGYGMLFYCLDLIGKKKTSKKNNIYELKPLVWVDLPDGRDRSIVNKLQVASDDGRIYKKLWLLKQIADVGVQVPESLDKEDLAKEFTKDFLDKAEEEVAKFRLQYGRPLDPDGVPYSIESDEWHAYRKKIGAYQLGCRGNVDWEFTGLNNPYAAAVKDDPDSDDDEGEPENDGQVSLDSDSDLLPF